MKTTELFVEHLVIGVGTLLWLSLAAVCIVGSEPVLLLFEPDRINTAFVVLIFIAFTYLLGVLSDRAYLLFWRGLEGRRSKKKGVSLADYYRFEVDVALSKNNDLRDFLAYYTSRMRILRAYIVNFAVSGIIAAGILLPDWRGAAALFVVGVAFSSASGAAYYQLAGKYYGYVAEIAGRFEASDL